MKNHLILLLLFLFGVIAGTGITVVILTTETKKHLPASETMPVTKTSAKFSVENPPKESLIGSIASFSGEVKWQSRIATEGAKLRKVVPLHQGESLETMKDGFLTFIISTCQVHMEPESTLNIIQTLPASLVLEQTKGAISYTVSCSYPLAVRSDSLLIQKTSGEMKVVIDEEEQSIQIENLQDEATVGYNSMEGKTTLVSLPGQREYVFDSEKKEGILKKLSTKLHGVR